jgi:uncharacterized protein
MGKFDTIIRPLTKSAEKRSIIMKKINEILNEIRILTNTTANETQEELDIRALTYEQFRRGAEIRRSNARINKNRNHCTSDSGRIIHEVHTLSEAAEQRLNELTAAAAWLMYQDVEATRETEGGFRLTFRGKPASEYMAYDEAEEYRRDFKQVYGVDLLIQHRH